MQKTSQKKRTTGSNNLARRASIKTAKVVKIGGRSFAPTASSMAVTTGRGPSLRSDRASVRIVHSEYFDKITSVDNNFKVKSYQVNPGLNTCFPWLSGVATRYETYKFRRLEFFIRTRSPSTYGGTVGMCFDFDALDPAPINQLSALTYHDKTADSAWSDQSLVCDLRLGDKTPSKYTRPGLPTSYNNYDLKTYDIGTLHVFTDGTGNSANCGLLGVSYDIELFTPQVETPVGGSFSNTTGLDAAHCFGSLPTISVDGNSTFPFTVSSSDTITFMQNFEGVLSFLATGTGFNNSPAPTLTGEGAVTAIANLCNAAATYQTGNFRINALLGDSLSFAMGATTISNIVWYLTKGRYDNLG